MNRQPPLARTVRLIDIWIHHIFCGAALLISVQCLADGKMIEAIFSLMPIVVFDAILPSIRQKKALRQAIREARIFIA